MNISDLANQYDLERFKVQPPSPTLFGIDWKLANSGHCPLCMNKLYSSQRNPDVLYCKSKKHLKRFAIKRETIEKYGESTGNRTQSKENNH